MTDSILICQWASPSKDFISKDIIHSSHRSKKASQQGKKKFTMHRSDLLCLEIVIFVLTNMKFAVQLTRKEEKEK